MLMVPCDNGTQKKYLHAGTGAGIESAPTTYTHCPPQRTPHPRIMTLTYSLRGAATIMNTEHVRRNKPRTASVRPIGTSTGSHKGEVSDIAIG